MSDYESTAARNARMSNARYIQHTRRVHEIQNTPRVEPPKALVKTDPDPEPPARVSGWGDRLIGLVVSFAISVGLWALIIGVIALLFFLDKVRFNVSL